MRRMPSWVPSVAVFFAVIAGVFVYGAVRPHHDTPATQSDTLQTDASRADAQAVWSHGEDGSAANAEEHWRKHGGEFPEYHSARDYEHGALDFVNHPPPGTQVKHRDNGDTLFYDPSTGDFAVEDQKGEPRTFFRPRHGDKYWAHQ